MLRGEVPDCHYFYDISSEDMKKLLKLRYDKVFYLKNILAYRLLTRLQAVPMDKRDHNRVTSVFNARKFNDELMRGG